MTVLTPDFLSTKPETFQALRHLLSQMKVQEGVIDGGDLQVVQRAAGANMSVDVGAGGAFVVGDEGTRQGMYHAVNDAIVNVPVGASNASNPRIDQLVLYVNDSTYNVRAPADAGQLAVLAGTPTVGATLANRTGAAALPASCLRCADILVPASSSSVITANIRDRRLWARGYNNTIKRVANASAGSDYSTASTTFALLDGTNLAQRVEVGNSGLLECTLRGSGTNTVTAGEGFALSIRSDGVDAVPSEAGSKPQVLVPGISFSTYFNWTFTIAVAAGSHLIQPAWRATAGTAIIRANASNPFEFTVREVTGQNANNGLA